MFGFVRSELEKLSRDTGFIQNVLEKAIHLLDVLNQLSRHPFLKQCFVLKGGTALNIFYFDLPRLSVDADLNYVRSIDKRKMIIDRDQIDQLIPVIFGTEYHVNFSKKEYALSQFELRYQTLAGSRDKLKLEINYLHRLPIIEPVQTEIDHFGIKVKFPLLKLEELLATKIIALLSRYTPRDLYDVYLASKHIATLNTELLKQLVLYYALIARESVFDLFELKLDRFAEQDIHRHLHPLLINNLIPSLGVLKREVSKSLKPLLDLDEQQTEIIHTFYDTGKLHMEVLFSRKTLHSNITMAPPFVWKKTNIESIKNNKTR